jgi:hypothetical protein
MTQDWHLQNKYKVYPWSSHLRQHIYGEQGSLHLPAPTSHPQFDLTLS